MDDKSWNRLLRRIEDGLVVPVIGQQVLTCGKDNDSLQSQIAQHLLKQYDIEPVHISLTPFNQLNDVVIQIKKEQEYDLQDLYADIHDAIKYLTTGPDAHIPEPVRQIAAITSFQLFITLTPDDQLARTLRERCAVNEIIYSPYLPTSEGSDLPSDWQARHGEVQLLYLFGKARAGPMFAVHDEDLLEYVHNIIARGSHVPVKFLDELQQRSLLLIGCNFPEWLSRFFLRLTKQGRLLDTQRKREWLIENNCLDKNLVYFLESYSTGTKLISDISPTAFISELHQRWLARNKAVEHASSSKTGTVPRGALFFVSYCRGTDSLSATTLMESLQSQGVSSNEIWFDKNSIEPGNDLRNRILEGIQTCRYFIPLISKNADSLDEKYFRREWHEAIERSKAIQGRTFIFPIIVDQDFKLETYRCIPHEFKQLLIGHAPVGQPDEQTNAALKKLVRSERLTQNHA
ncbi:TIR domain-containing protein [Nitrosomonas aestuarii]|uniref:TIR domain-containing protein n=1 Tax=Nitrosomonas aestuarii TaxID=52441 RepID=A0A1I3YTL9_9PROT|nr:toll/interleukin-1 receptor domain-containing protein [Nitrosomonas aestuarii]SFK35135.1 TIR domain-containing protein [Nitrosomonas aestuarii]